MSLTAKVWRARLAGVRLPRMFRVWRSLPYYAVVAAFWVLVTATYAVLTALAAISFWFAVPALVGVAGVFAVVALSCFLLVLDAEDWWDDFRGQRRLAITCGMLSFASLLGGVGIGWSWMG